MGSCHNRFVPALLRWGFATLLFRTVLMTCSRPQAGEGRGRVLVLLETQNPRVVSKPVAVRDNQADRPKCFLPGQQITISLAAILSSMYLKVGQWRRGVRRTHQIASMGERAVGGCEEFPTLRTLRLQERGAL
jgi:hypothetical protein